MRFICFCLVVLLFSCKKEKDPVYSVADSPWPETLGNHRAIIHVSEPAEAVYLRLQWRRHDPEPGNKKFIILHQSSGDTISNILRIRVSGEACELIFGPVAKPGKYTFYYLPFSPDNEHGFFRFGYLEPETPPDPQWISDHDLTDSKSIKILPSAACIEIQARTAFDSFYPMEIIPTAEEKKNYLSRYPGDYLIFTEDREHPIRMRNEIPLSWTQHDPATPVEGTALQNEYYTFQLGLYAVNKDIKNVKFEFSGLTYGDEQIPGSSFTCFNTEGMDPYGNSFTLRSDVPESTVQAYWFGVDIGRSVKPGLYSGSLTVIPENAALTSIPVRLNIINEVLADRGDSEPWRHSRIRWLNSTRGMDNEPVPPYTPIRVGNKQDFHLLGKNIELSNLGLPAGIRVGETEILNRPIRWSLKTSSGNSMNPSGSFELDLEAPGLIEGHTESHTENFSIRNQMRMESDGYLNFKIQLKAEENLQISDFMLEIPFQKATAKYMMGMGLPGTSVPEIHQASWEGPQDSFWIGNTHGGLHCELRGTGYHGPLLSLYRPTYPASWYNDGKGSMEVQRTSNEVLATIHSGERRLLAGEEIVFEFSLIITPVKEVDTESQFTNRYFQNYPEPVPDEQAIYEGVKIINIHHANRYNPYINYPFVATREMKDLVDHLHAMGKKTKIYYTVRELSTRTYELWALRSLGHEILLGREATYDWLISSGRDAGHPWLIEHLEGDYAPAWYSRLEKGEYDAAIVTTSGISRWYNYYIEGLAWLVKNIGIDGLYLDDVAYDRRILKRMRKVMEEVKPGCIIDLHSNNDFTKGPAMQYAEFFPYVDKLWFGEAFDYDRMSPESWLVEVSGIPFGLMGDMLQNGGNRWLGMLFGMTNRPPWSHGGTQYDPVPVWKLWDAFGIAEAEMIGFWEKGCPVRTSDPKVLATVYRRKDRALIALGSWNQDPVDVYMAIDWDQLGLDKTKVKIVAPSIEGYQEEKHFPLDKPVPVDPLKGWLLIISDTGN